MFENPATIYTCRLRDGCKQVYLHLLVSQQFHCGNRCKSGASFFLVQRHLPATKTLQHKFTMFILN